jgi:hypothetical protein
VLPGCAHPADEHVVPEPLIVDTDRSISILDEYEEADFDLRERETWYLPLGSVLHEAVGTWVPVTQAGSSASPMVKGCAFSTADGTLSEVIPDVLGDTHTVAIYDVRCSDSVYAWVELDVLTHAWRLYASEFSNGKIQGKASELWSANENYDPPGFVCTGNSVLWQITPSLVGNKTS